MFMIILTLAFVASGCAPVSYHLNELRDSTEKVTIAQVQKEIKIGMPSSKVIEILGSPNIITTDEKRREVWIYDEIATEVAYSDSGAGLKLMTPGVSGAARTSQRTLTVIIKFDEEGKVRDFAYHVSRF